MKYVIKFIICLPVALIGMLFIVISGLIGTIALLWDFKADSYDRAAQWLDKKIHFSTTVADTFSKIIHSF